MLGKASFSVCSWSYGLFRNGLAWIWSRWDLSQLIVLEINIKDQVSCSNCFSSWHRFFMVYSILLFVRDFCQAWHLQCSFFFLQAHMSLTRRTTSFTSIWTRKLCYCSNRVEVVEKRCGWDLRLGKSVLTLLGLLHLILHTSKPVYPRFILHVTCTSARIISRLLVFVSRIGSWLWLNTAFYVNLLVAR